MEAGTNGTAQRQQLPRFKSHKVVEAGKIVGVLQLSVGGAQLSLSWGGPVGVTIDVSQGWLDRAIGAAGSIAAIEGGYYVCYEDGYDSWSPAKAFEEGYSQDVVPPVGRAAGEEPEARALRTITTHVVNEANDKLKISVLDEPGPGGASHLYQIDGFDTGSNPSCPFRARYGAPAKHSTVLFQNGAINEVGVNGVTHEALLAIVMDRLEAFQAGPFACDENRRALTLLQHAAWTLRQRTERRMRAGTEGTLQGS